MNHLSSSRELLLLEFGLTEQARGKRQEGKENERKGKEKRRGEKGTGKSREGEKCNQRKRTRI